MNSSTKLNAFIEEWMGARDKGSEVESGFKRDHDGPSWFW